MFPLGFMLFVLLRAGAARNRIGHETSEKIDIKWAKSPVDINI